MVSWSGRAWEHQVTFQNFSRRAWGHPRCYFNSLSFPIACWCKYTLCFTKCGIFLKKIKWKGFEPNFAHQSSNRVELFTKPITGLCLTIRPHLIMTICGSHQPPAIVIIAESINFNLRDVKEHLYDHNIAIVLWTSTKIHNNKKKLSGLWLESFNYSFSVS